VGCALRAIYGCYTGVGVELSLIVKYLDIAAESVPYAAAHKGRRESRLYASPTGLVRTLAHKHYYAVDDTGHRIGYAVYPLTS
jgi:hypothetical protein